MIENIYHHFHHVFLPNRKILRRFSSHPFQLRWHPVRLCNDHAELQTVHRYSRNSIRIRHQADRHSHGMALKLIHLKMHQLLPPLTPRIPVNLWIIDSTKALEKLSLILKIEKKKQNRLNNSKCSKPFGAWWNYRKLIRATGNAIIQSLNQSFIFAHTVSHFNCNCFILWKYVFAFRCRHFSLLRELVSIHIESR